MRTITDFFLIKERKFTKIKIHVLILIEIKLELEQSIILIV